MNIEQLLKDLRNDLLDALRRDRMTYDEHQDVRGCVNDAYDTLKTAVSKENERLVSDNNSLCQSIRTLQLRNKKTEKELEHLRLALNTDKEDIK